MAISTFTITVFTTLLILPATVTPIPHSLPSISSPILSLSNICSLSRSPHSCVSLLSEMPTSLFTNTHHLLSAFLQDSELRLKKHITLFDNLLHQSNNPKVKAAAEDCTHLLQISSLRLTTSIQILANQTTYGFSDAHSWLSSVLTNYDTCHDGLAGLTIPNRITASLKDAMERSSVSLGLLVFVAPSEYNKKLDLKRKFPSWLSAMDRKILLQSAKGISPNVVVAKDGSGKYKTVQEAVSAAPDNSKTRYVIYVKKGTYKEKVEVGTKKKNIMLVGDGKDQTLITGNLNVVDGATTFNSATLAAVGDGFMAQDMWIENTAGAAKHQAVALRVGSDRSVINRCRVDGYQDSLYVHSNRQFFRETTVTGTVDFIFGNAAVVFQSCDLMARRPMENQNNMVTAQGRVDPNQNTGISIQSCNIVGGGDLEPVKGNYRTYLGRPWKEYSRTVVMQSFIGDLVDPQGWAAWSGDFALNTLYYGEYANRGAGADTSKRVKWRGFHVITNPAEARQFTVAGMIQGGDWLPGTGVAFVEGL